MKHIGIVAEYNPFHNGHAYQIQTLHAQFPQKKILVMMSGNYVQRGEPAIFHKSLRTSCALAGGADIVFELPGLYSTASAEFFASASVLGLWQTGLVDTLCFGVEDEKPEAFLQIASLLIQEPEAYQLLLKEQLRKGISYPKARSIAVGTYFQNPDYESILQKPNNILGIEYYKAILRYKLPIEPFMIRRTGNGYHDTGLQSPYPSATALRSVLKEQENLISSGAENLKTCIPEPVLEMLFTSPLSKPLLLSDFYPYLEYALWEKQHQLSDYFEITEELANILTGVCNTPLTLFELFKQLSRRNYTETRLTRALLHVTLNYKKSMLRSGKEILPYLRLLGFQKESTAILKEMKETCSLPIVNKVAHTGKLLSPDALSFFSQEIHADVLYQKVFYGKYGILLPTDYQQTVIIR